LQGRQVIRLFWKRRVNMVVGKKVLYGAAMLGALVVSGVAGADISSLLPRPAIVLSKSNTLVRVKCEEGFVATFDENGGEQANIAGLSRAVVACPNAQPPFKVEVRAEGGVIGVTGGGDQKTFIQMVFQAK
jgi:hypothetical protein